VGGLAASLPIRHEITNDLRDGISNRAHGIPLWLSGLDPLASWSTPRRRAIEIAKLNPEHPIFTNAEKSRRLDELLATELPDGWAPESASPNDEAAEPDWLSAQQAPVLDA
jgi:hypothetical protein